MVVALDGGVQVAASVEGEVGRGGEVDARRAVDEDDRRGEAFGRVAQAAAALPGFLGVLAADVAHAAGDEVALLLRVDLLDEVGLWLVAFEGVGLLMGGGVA